jgi:glycosyltransferase involved in cell wall biosynthesis
MNILDPKISVVMSVSDVNLRYLNLSILSILNQSFSNFEFIIIADTNNLGIIELLNKYKNKDNRIKLFLNTHKLGLAKSLNIGINRSQSKYIARQDADDISSPDRLKKQFIFLQNNSHVAVIGSYAYKINKDDKIIGKIKKKIKHKKLFYYENLLIHPSTMFIKNIFNNVGRYNENLKVSQDYDLWVRFSKKYILKVYPEYLLKLRIHDESISSNNKELQYLYSFFIGLGVLDDIFLNTINEENILDNNEFIIKELIKKNRKYVYKIIVREMVLLNKFKLFKISNFLNPHFIIELAKFYYYKPKLLLRNFLK